MDEREESKDTPKGGRLSSWLKAAVGTVAGLLSGAAMMYVSPLIDRVVKPAKPLANFAVDHEGTTVTFQNRSSGIHAGWWDYGDGSALEAVDPNQQTVSHTYANPGDYTAKLTVQNLLGDESERVVSLHLDAPAHTDPPAIESLEVAPAGGTAFAPATFRVVGKVKNAQMCLWNFNDGRPMQIDHDPATSQGQVVTFDRPGTYKIQLVAMTANGTAPLEKTQTVTVLPPPTGSVTAVLHVTDAATRVEAVTVPHLISKAVPPTMKEAAQAFSTAAKARPGWQIKAVRVTTASGQGPVLQDQGELALDPSLVKGGNVRNLKLELAPDHGSVRLVGELLRPANLGKQGAVIPNLELPVQLVEERRTAAQHPATPVTATLTAPGSAMLLMPPLPADWVNPQRQMTLELRAGNRALWQGSQLPRATPVTIDNRAYLLSATSVGGQLRVDLVDARTGISPSAN
jgi:PKD repeat protein